MPPPQQQFSRVNLAEIKAQIIKKIGHERAKKYFGYLTLLLSQKLSKTQFDNICYKTIGADNISLHNRFIQAILKNAACSRAAPYHVFQQGNSRLVKAIRHKTCNANSSTDESWGNGNNALPSPTQKWRSNDSKTKDKPSPFVPHGRVDSNSFPAGSDNVPAKCLENGDSSICDLYMPFQHVSGNAEQPDGETCENLFPSEKSQKNWKVVNPQEQLSVDSKATPGQNNVEDGDELEQLDDGSKMRARGPLQAPLGVPFCPGSVGAAKRTSFNKSVSYFTSLSCNQEDGIHSNDLLPDSRSLQKHVEQVAATAGLQSVSLECANLLNTGLDVYLKRLIKSCLELKGSSHSHESGTQVQNSQGVYRIGQGLNGFGPVHSIQFQNKGSLVEAPLRTRNGTHISFQDFATAMELDPQQLGEDWPLQREKILSNSFLITERK